MVAQGRAYSLKEFTVSLLRNIRLHTLMVVMLASLLVASVIGLGIGMLSSHKAADTLSLLNRINVEQLNAVNRGDALLNEALLEIEVAATSQQLDRLDKAQELADRLVSFTPTFSTWDGSSFRSESSAGSLVPTA